MVEWEEKQALDSMQMRGKCEPQKEEKKYGHKDGILKKEETADCVATETKERECLSEEASSQGCQRLLRTCVH